MNNQGVYLNDLGIINSQAEGKIDVLNAILSGRKDHFIKQSVGDKEYPVALCSIRDKRSNRINKLLKPVCEEIAPSVKILISKYGHGRIGVILGSTDNGSEQALNALREFKKSGNFPEGYELKEQQAHTPAEYIKEFFCLNSIATTISTACTSSGSAFILARKFLESELLDGVIVGGADIVSESVLKGFVSLEAVDPNPTNPFSSNRKGINLGEGAALFVMSRDRITDSHIKLIGCGETSDAHHITAPDPGGAGAVRAMIRALKDSRLSTVDYINLHGTGTELNDKMEAIAMGQVFPDFPLMSSTKPMVGHTLGAASAIELGFCWLLLSKLNEGKRLPPHLWDEKRPEDMQPLNFVPENFFAEKIQTCMSNSYAFGGCNVSLIISRVEK
ncbi:MAG: beta-ketoacyl synthase N-terminal-like domain-containing protein [Spirochaetaceae bacterium]|jgi:3-oxoacyl-[acyl-carrier-protein] synthase-1|nr:beta-ketoacyl synthase N-terminal-like domain-containing protein [Spirochaetaceae bacterium]